MYGADGLPSIERQLWFSITITKTVLIECWDAHVVDCVRATAAGVALVVVAALRLPTRGREREREENGNERAPVESHRASRT